VDHTVVWFPAELEDVEPPAEYIARDSEFYACSVLDKAVYITGNLSCIPRRGESSRRLETKESESFSCTVTGSFTDSREQQ
jgi:hypothetical protein